MEQKAKRIGKLNIIDLIACADRGGAGTGGLKFTGKNGDSISYDRPQTKVSYR